MIVRINTTTTVGLRFTTLKNYFTVGIVKLPENSAVFFCGLQSPGYDHIITNCPGHSSQDNRECSRDRISCPVALCNFIATSRGDESAKTRVSWTGEAGRKKKSNIFTRVCPRPSYIFAQPGLQSYIIAATRKQSRLESGRRGENRKETGRGKTVSVVEKTQDYRLFADLLTFLAIFLAINTPDRGQNMTRHSPLSALQGWEMKSGPRCAPEIVVSSLRKSSREFSAEARTSSRWFQGLSLVGVPPQWLLPKVPPNDNQGTAVSLVAELPVKMKIYYRTFGNERCFWKWRSYRFSYKVNASGDDAVVEKWKQGKKISVKNFCQAIPFWKIDLQSESNWSTDFRIDLYQVFNHWKK